MAPDGLAGFDKEYAAQALGSHEVHLQPELLARSKVILAHPILVGVPEIHVIHPFHRKIVRALKFHLHGVGHGAGE